MELPNTNSDNEVTFICRRVADMPIPAYEAIRRSCVQCGQPVWLSLRTAELAFKEYPLAQRKSKCVECSTQEIASMDLNDFRRQAQDYEAWLQTQPPEVRGKN